MLPFNSNIPNSSAFEWCIDFLVLSTDLICFLAFKLLEFLKKELKNERNCSDFLIFGNEIPLEKPIFELKINFFSTFFNLMVLVTVFLFSRGFT